MGKNIFNSQAFHDEAAARAWFEAARWPNGPVCPHCKGTAITPTKIAGRYRCKAKACRKDFTVMVGTVMERSHAKLTQWAVAFTMAAATRRALALTSSIASLAASTTPLGSSITGSWKRCARAAWTCPRWAAPARS